ncbi:polyol/monosaccharide transporter 5 [Prunus dulcis]|uniref:Polyol/monosaccharide transporter 5 n=1 Tax=Prunus dulcis TaxID=3755 RepID=A0A4Y1RZX7_PRUDU|nr:polyol/monosaccharide transporter 5 [Prunus dulcis]
MYTMTEMTDRKVEDNAVSGEPQNKRIADFDPPEKPNANKFAIVCATLACMTSILLGYDIGVMSGANIFIKDDLKITDVQVEVLAGTLNIYSLIGSGLAGVTSDWIGRRYTIVLSGTIFFIGAILMGVAPGYGLLMFGRFVAGVGVGYGLMIAPVYTVEISPALSRGFLTSFPEVFVNVGILLGYVSNYAFSKLPVHMGWRFMLGLGAIPSIVLVVGVLAMPESPRWLVMKGRLGMLSKSSTKPQLLRKRLSSG